MSATTTLFPKAVIFDAYGTLFDVHSVIAAAEQLFPGHGDALSQLWRLKQIEYTQLRTLADSVASAESCDSGDSDGSADAHSVGASAARKRAHYRPFWDITLDALRFAAKKLQLTLDRAAEKRLMDEYACLSAFPDAVSALRRLHGTPARSGLAILSNGNPQMLDIAVKSAGMTGLFDHVLSVDAVRAYKPAPAAYALAARAFEAQPRELVFVSSNGWDVAGAAWFGFTTFWLNRMNAPVEELGVVPHGTGTSMSELSAFLSTLVSTHASSGKPAGNRARHSPGA